MPQRIQRIRHISSRELAMLYIHAIGVELWHSARCDDNAWRVAMFNDVQSEDESPAESCDETVVGSIGEGEEVDLWA